MKTGRVANFVKVARRDEIPDGTGKTVEAGGRKIALFNAGGQFYAIDNSCRHRGGPIAIKLGRRTLAACLRVAAEPGLIRSTLFI